MVNPDEAVLGLIQGSKVHDEPRSILEVPPQRLTTPDFVDFHMILDHELDQLSKAETGIIGSLGFVGLGGVIGFAPAFLGALEKISAVPVVQPSAADVGTLICLPACVVLALLCLTIFGLSVRRNWGLSAKIRARKKQAMTRTS